MMEFVSAGLSAGAVIVLLAIDAGTSGKRSQRSEWIHDERLRESRRWELR